MSGRLLGFSRGEDGDRGWDEEDGDEDDRDITSHSSDVIRPTV